MKNKPHPDDEPLPPVAFPMETIFPGIHKLRPDIARAEAETFLASGGRPTGFPLDDPAIRGFLTDPALPFTAFQIAPVPPPWTALLAPLPFWHHPDGDAVADTILADLRERVPGLRSDLRVAIMEGKEVWIRRAYRTGTRPL